MHKENDKHERRRKGGHSSRQVLEKRQIRQEQTRGKSRREKRKKGGRTKRYRGKIVVVTIHRGNQRATVISNEREISENTDHMSKFLYRIHEESG